MRNLSNQSNAMLRVSSGFCVVVRIGVSMRVGDGRAINNMRMGKESRTCEETHKERYEEQRQYFIYFGHINHGAKIIIIIIYATIIFFYGGIYPYMGSGGTCCYRRFV